MMLPEHHLCTGCGSCAAVCPRHCITMTADKEGFRYPAVDSEKCVRCGLCQRSCPVLTAPTVSEATVSVAARNRDWQVRRCSSSGGVFTALARHTIAAGGAVCAAAYTETFAVRHEITCDEHDLERLRSAKYAQSEAEHCFASIKTLLKDGSPVLFVGTPCQAAALKGYLGKEYENLLTVDMICHGVPSAHVWQRYVQERTAAEASAITAVNLRSKTTGWSRYNYSVEFRHENGVLRTAPQGNDLFLQGFVRNLYLRPSCANCSFKGVERCSDLTLGDCWGIWELHPEFDDDKGTSLLMIHSPRGQQAWEGIKNQFDFLPIESDSALRHNPSAVQSSEPHPNRAAFFADLSNACDVSLLISKHLTPPEPAKPTLVKRILNKLFKH